MRNVATADSDIVLTAPPDSPSVGDLHAQRLEDGSIASVWWLDDEERAAIGAGANIALIVASLPHPVVALQVVTVAGDGEDAPETLAQLVELRRKARSQREPE